MSSLWQQRVRQSRTTTVKRYQKLIENHPAVVYANVPVLFEKLYVDNLGSKNTNIEKIYACQAVLDVLDTILIKVLRNEREPVTN